jgi:chromosome segregation ATPase
MIESATPAPAEPTAAIGLAEIEAAARDLDWIGNRFRAIFAVTDWLARLKALHATTAEAQTRLDELRAQTAAQERAIAEAAEKAELHASSIRAAAEGHMDAVKSEAERHLANAKAEAERIVEDGRAQSMRDLEAASENLSRWSRHAEEAKAEHQEWTAKIETAKAGHAVATAHLDAACAEHTRVLGLIAELKAKL